MAFMDTIEAIYDNPALAVVNALILALVGFNHVTDPANSLVAMLVGGLPEMVYQVAGVLVGGSGVLQLFEAAQRLG